MKIKTFLNIFLIITLFQYTAITHAQVTYTESDYALLPPYCKPRLNMRDTDQATIKRWKSNLGPMWIHIHHYCWGINSLNKAQAMFGGDRSQKNQRKRLLQSVIPNMNYVIDRAPPNFVLLPEFHFKKGEALIELERQTEGMQEFYKSIQINPKYSRAYKSISKNYKKNGMNKEALEIIQQGLKHNPKSKSLNRQLKKLQKTK